MANSPQPSKMNDMMKQLTSIGRPVDPRYPSNLAVAVFSGVMFVVFVAVNLLDDVSVGDSLQEGFSVAVFAFLAWAIGREIDPDYNLTAYVAMILAVGAYHVWGGSNLLGVALVMMGLRLVNRTTGLKPMIGDNVVITLGAGVLSAMGHPLLGVATVVAFGLNALLDDPDSPNGWVFGGVALVATVIGALLADSIERDFALDTEWAIVAGVIGVLYLGVALTTQTTFVSVGDHRNTALSRLRIMWARLLLLGVAVGWLLWAGENAGTALALLFVVMIGGIVTAGLNRLGVSVP